MKYACGALLVALSLLLPATAHAQPTIWGGLPTGPYAVGYRSEYVRDASRSFFPEKDFKGRRQPGDRRRPVPLRIWFPARAGTGAAMVYSDYLTVKAGNGGLEGFAKLYASRNAVVHKVMASKYGGDLGNGWERIAATPVHSRLGAQPLAGRFPIIVYGGGAYNSVDENVVLLEYLASTGSSSLPFPPSIGGP